MPDLHFKPVRELNGKERKELRFCFVVPVLIMVLAFAATRYLLPELLQLHYANIILWNALLLSEYILYRNVKYFAGKDGSLASVILEAWQEDQRALLQEVIRIVLLFFLIFVVALDFTFIHHGYLLEVLALLG